MIIHKVSYQNCSGCCSGYYSEAAATYFAAAVNHSNAIAYLLIGSSRTQVVSQEDSVGEILLSQVYLTVLQKHSYHHDHTGTLMHITNKQVSSKRNMDPSTPYNAAHALNNANIQKAPAHAARIAMHRDTSWFVLDSEICTAPRRR
jgi:hypothetical protein